MVKHIHVPIPNQRSESASSHVVEEGAVRTALSLIQRLYPKNQAIEILEPGCSCGQVLTSKNGFP
jgi:hypothetical protein